MTDRIDKLRRAYRNLTPFYDARAGLGKQVRDTHKKHSPKNMWELVE